MTPERFQRLQTCLNKRQLDLTVIMENIHKAHNFAAIIRNCDAVGIHEVHAITETGTINEHHHTSAGTQKWLSVFGYKNSKEPLKQLKTKGFQLLAAHVDPSSTDFREVDYTKPTALIMGSELYGISEATAKQADQCIKIPMHGLVESFNVSVATALILYEAQRQREAAGLYDTPQLTGEAYHKQLFEWCYPEAAKHCQSQKKPYPDLDTQGYIIGKPKQRLIK